MRIGPRGELWDWSPVSAAATISPLPGSAMTSVPYLAASRQPHLPVRFVASWATTESGFGPTRKSSRRRRRITDVLERLVQTTFVRCPLGSATTSIGVSRDVWTRRAGERTTIGIPTLTAVPPRPCAVPIFPAISNHDSNDSEGGDDRAQMEDNFHIHERFHHGLETASACLDCFLSTSSTCGSRTRYLDTSLDTERRRSTATFRRRNIRSGFAHASAGG